MPVFFKYMRKMFRVPKLYEARGGRFLRGLALFAFAVLLSLCLKGCMAFDRKWRGDPDSVLKFSHVKHAKHIAECQACHYDSASEAVIKAGHAQCVECHPEARDNLPAEKGCLLCHRTLTPKPATPAERPRYAVAIFGHKEHVTVDCAACHGRVDSRISLVGATYPLMEDCLECHFPGLPEKPSARCSLCHASLAADVKPENHEQPQWGIVHGQWNLNQPELCSRCHVKARDCDACHSRERPQTHTATFRMKTHGFQAMSRPERCETCHRQDFCESCHRTTRPRTHTASFRNRPWLHCAVCHLPLDEGNRCSVCHVGEPHARVVAKSPPPRLLAAGLIDPSGPCLPCHPVDRRPITHPYNTITPYECVQCHIPRF